MPYIVKEHRKRLDAAISSLAQTVREISLEEGGQYCGLINYIVTKLIYCLRRQDLDDGYKWGYADYNEMVGTLECCKLELYRRSTAPYEDKKIESNGDVD